MGESSRRTASRIGFIGQLYKIQILSAAAWARRYQQRWRHSEYDKNVTVTSTSTFPLTSIQCRRHVESAGTCRSTWTVVVEVVGTVHVDVGSMTAKIGATERASNAIAIFIDYSFRFFSGLPDAG
jgi:hypothetical protein